uniref:Mediator of RNA polymerase II transcription subunit 16 n=1 Tax=Bionectria ochroleuca TaxID=29856 RepID=A0A8H7N9I4_BIOOC
MADKEIPLILGNDLSMHLGDVGDVGDVDDLFGDASALPLRPTGMQLEQRIDRLRNRGCYQTVAWSRVGTIASITADGQELELRYLRCRPDNGEWELTEPTTCALVKGTPEIPLVHLEWAITNNPELAIFDASGRVALLIFSTTITHPFLVRKWDTDIVDEMQSIAGAHWLPVAPNTQPAAAANSSNAGNRQSFNVVTALLCVTMGGILKMFWMQLNNKMEETTLELESIRTADEIVTHAAFASEKKYLILALVTASKQLKFVKVEIHWGSQPGKAAGPQNTRYNATLVEKHCATAGWSLDSLEDASMPEISHLLALPSILDNSGKNMVPPVIVSVRSRPPGAGPFPPAQSIIDRWEAVEQRHGLHPAIEQLGNRRNSVSSEPSTGTFLRPLEPIVIPKCIINIQSARYGKILIITFADGSVEYRDRYTFEEIYTTRETAKLSNLREAGWNFADDMPCQQTAFSPTFCSMVLMGEDGKLKWSKLKYSDGDFGNSMQDEQYAATIAGLTITAATSIRSQTNFDDMLAVVRPHVSKKKLMQDWVGELIRILNIQVDYSGEHSHDALLKNEQMRSCLSILINLGFKGDTLPRSFQSTHALIAATVRSTAWNITLASSSHFPVAGKKSPLDDHEVVDVLVTSVRWSLDLIAWLSDSLFELMHDDEFIELLTPARTNELAIYLHTKNDVSLQLLLCSSSRSFLMALCRRIGHLALLSNKAMEFYRKQSAEANAAKAPNPYLRQAYQRLQQATSSGFVSVGEFEKLITALKMGIMHSYDNVLTAMVKRQPNPPQGKQEDEAVKVARSQCETRMLLAAAPHPSLIPVLKKFFTEDVPAFRKTTDPAQLFFENFDVLDVSDDKGDVDGVKWAHIDVLSKTKLHMSPTQQWRRCTRCTAVMEELPGRGPGFTFLFSQQRRCLCSGTWAVLPQGRLI